MEQVQQVVEAYDAQIRELTRQVQVLTEALNAKLERRPKPSLPDPERFSGAPFTWDNWLPLMKAKLRIDGKAIGRPEAQFFYVYGRLDGKVQALVSPQLERAEELQDYDPNNLLKQLTRLFDDPNKIRDAEDKLHSIKQDDDSLPVFLAKFERLLYKAKANTWSDNSKIAQLRRSLNKQVRNRLDAQINVPDKYDDFVAMLLKIASRTPRLEHSKAGGEPMEVGALHPVSMQQKMMESWDSEE